MKDLTRDQAIEWCVENHADFIAPVYPPPNGWAWADFNSQAKSLILTPIFTTAENKDILAKDVIIAYARRMAADKLLAQESI